MLIALQLGHPIRCMTLREREHWGKIPRYCLQSIICPFSLQQTSKGHIPEVLMKT